MAILHQAELRPTKLEFLNSWARAQSWFVSDADAELAIVSAFRFDDPAGQVGVETFLIRASNGPTMQVPFTYRGAPLEGAQANLIGTMQHSVLGERWVYDGAGDPVYLQTVADTALNGGHQAKLIISTADGQVEREPNARVVGTGVGVGPVRLPSVTEIVVRQEATETVVTAGSLQVVIHRVIIDGDLGDSEPNSVAGKIGTIRGTWTDSPDERELVRVTASD